MELIPALDEKEVGKAKRDSSGIALFMVISAISVLSILVTEFTYVAHVNQQIAFDSLDSLKAHYLAKSGFKLSLLRLKAYMQIKSLVGGATGGNSALSSAIPKGLLEKIWSFPFMYPIPSTIPGLTTSDKEAIDKFSAASTLEGNFTALIESESSKYNLNLIMAPFVPPAPSPSPGATSSPGPTPSPSASFNPQAARDSLSAYLLQLMTNKIETDDGFSSEYRDYRLEDLIDNIAAWGDNTYQRRQSAGQNELNKFKQAPFYSLSELHMVPLMDDDLYDLFAPSLTVSATPGINVNTMVKQTLRALVPQMTDTEADEFFKFRDSTEQDNLFRSPDDFFNYILKNVQGFRGEQSMVDEFKQSLASKNIRIVVDETDFKITVQAQVNQATRLIEAWVTLGNTLPQPTPSGRPSPPPQPQVVGVPNNAPQRGDPGFKITYMRIL